MTVRLTLSNPEHTIFLVAARSLKPAYLQPFETDVKGHEVLLEFRPRNSADVLRLQELGSHLKRPTPPTHHRFQGPTGLMPLPGSRSPWSG